MTRHSYTPPSRQERELKARVKELEHRCALLEADASGAALIAEQQSLIHKMTHQICSLKKSDEKKSLRMSTLQAKNRELRELASSYFHQIAQLKFDVKVSHTLWNESQRELEKTERARYRWATVARALSKEKSLYLAEIRRLSAKLNRSPQNSSLPPSSDPNKKIIHNSRVKTGRKPGAQAGHTGHKRRMYIPDEVINLALPKGCPECGGTQLELLGKPKHRQISDLVITVKTTEYVGHDCICGDCGKRIGAQFPGDCKNEANYGNGVKAIATVLVNRCNVSIDNMTEFLHDATNGRLKLSKGSAHNYLAQFSHKAKDEIGTILGSIQKAPVVGSDATHTRSAGKTSYIYTFNTPDSAVFTASDCKGQTPLVGSVIDGHTGVICHDHDKSYYHFGGAHAECGAHILRYLKGVRENEPDTHWAKDMTSVLVEAHEACKAARNLGMKSLSAEAIASFTARYDSACRLAKTEYESGGPYHSKYKPEGINLSKRLIEYRDCHLAFMHNLDIPFDNNASERHLRVAKGKIKQSGGFRSTTHGETYYCDFLSVVKTASLRDMNVLKTVQAIFAGESDLFAQPKVPLISSDP